MDGPEAVGGFEHMDRAFDLGREVVPGLGSAASRSPGVNHRAKASGFLTARG